MKRESLWWVPVILIFFIAGEFAKDYYSPWVVGTVGGVIIAVWLCWFCSR